MRHHTDFEFLRNMLSHDKLIVMHPHSILRKHSQLDVSLHCIPCKWEDYERCGDSMVARINQWMEFGFQFDVINTRSKEELLEVLPEQPDNGINSDEPDSSEEVELENEVIDRWMKSVHDPICEQARGEEEK